MSKYRKHEVETKVKEAYSILSNVIGNAIAENGPLDDWDYSFSTKDFSAQYIEPYLKYTMKTNVVSYQTYNIDALNHSHEGYYYYRNYDPMWYKLANGMLLLVKIPHATYTPNAIFIVDINSSKGPNRAGVDVFTFYITKEKEPRFDTCNQAYYDTCKWSSEKILAEQNAGGNGQGFCCANYNGPYNGALCARVIQLNGWKIPDNYPIKF